MLKAAKKLKFWSKTNNKKKRNNTRDSCYFPPPPPCCCCTCSCSAIQPSAPPLPPWLDDRTLLPAAASYQQYMAPSPAYGVPVVEIIGGRRERSLFTDLGVRLIGCFCPCLRIREAYHLPDQQLNLN